MPHAAPARRSRLLALAIVGLLALRLVSAVVVLHSGIEGRDNILGGDAGRYDEIATAPGHPYRDVAVEYPPVALALIDAVHGHDRLATLTSLVVSQVALDLALVAVLAWAWNRRTAMAYLLISTPMLAYPFLYLRIDLLSVFLAMLGMGLVRRRDRGAGGVSLAAAVFAKVWPLVLAPVLLIERRTRATVAWTITMVAAASAWFAWSGTKGPMQVVTLRGAKGWQIESLVGFWYHAADPAGTHVEGNAWRTAAQVPGFGRPLLTALALATATAAWLLAARRRNRGAPDAVVYGLAPLVCVLGLLVFAPILSPQYVLWLLPFAAVVAAAGDRLQAGLITAVTALTTLGFATVHQQVDGRWWALVPLGLRNALLVAMLVSGIVGLWRGGGALQPALVLEPEVERTGHGRHEREGAVVPEPPAELGHVGEVHPVDA